jgi:hypothetical protein
MSTPAAKPLTLPKIWSETINSALNYERLFALGERKVRIRIHAESYRNQCYGRAEVFDPAANRWNQLAAIPGPLLKVDHLAGRGDLLAFDTDVNILLAESAAIFGA